MQLSAQSRAAILARTDELTAFLCDRRGLAPDAARVEAQRLVELDRENRELNHCNVKPRRA